MSTPTTLSSPAPTPIPQYLPHVSIDNQLPEGEEIEVGSAQVTPSPVQTFTGYRTDASGNVMGYYETHILPVNTDTVKFFECDPVNYPSLYVSPAQTLAASVSAATELLAKTDTVVKRINEGITLGLTTATTADVVAYITFIRALRAWVKSPSGSAPTEPAYPSGT